MQLQRITVPASDANDADEEPLNDDELAPWPDLDNDPEWLELKRQQDALHAEHLAYLRDHTDDDDELAPWPYDPEQDEELQELLREQEEIRKHGLTPEIIERRMKLLDERGGIFNFSQQEALEIAMDPMLAEENQDL